MVCESKQFQDPTGIGAQPSLRSLVWFLLILSLTTFRARAFSQFSGKFAG